MKTILARNTAFFGVLVAAAFCLSFNSSSVEAKDGAKKCEKKSYIHPAGDQFECVTDQANSCTSQCEALGNEAGKACEGKGLHLCEKECRKQIYQKVQSGECSRPGGGGPGDNRDK